MPNQKHQEQAAVETIDRHLIELQQREAAQKSEKPEPALVRTAREQKQKPHKISSPKAEAVPKPTATITKPKPKVLQSVKPIAGVPKAQPRPVVQKPPERVTEEQNAAIENPQAESRISQIYEVGVFDIEQVEPSETVIADAESSLYEPIIEWAEGELVLTAPFVSAEILTDTGLSLPVPEIVRHDYFQEGFEPTPEWQATSEAAELELVEQVAEKLNDLSTEASAEVQGIMEAVVQEIQKLKLLEAEDEESATEAVESRLEELVTRLLTVLDIEPDERTVIHFIKQLKVLVAEQLEEQRLAEDEGTHERKFSLQYLLKTLLQAVQEHHMPHLKLGRLVCQRLAQ